MSGFLLRIIINALVLILLIANLPGIFVDTLGAILLGATIIGLANATVRPLLALSSIPLRSVTGGGITLITNLVAPVMVTKALPGFVISSFFTPVASILLMTVCSFALSMVIQDR